MYGQHSLESVPERGLCIGTQAVDVPISWVYGFDSRDAGSRGSGNAKRPRQLIQVSEGTAVNATLGNQRAAVL